MAVQYERQYRRSFAWWMLATGIALAILVVGGAALGVMSGGGYVGGHLGILLGGGSYDFSNPIRSGYLGGLLGGALGGALAGVLCGLGQWLVVRRRVAQSTRAGLWWVGLTALGFALGGAFSAGGYVGGAIGRGLASIASQALGVNVNIGDSVGMPLGWLVSIALFGLLVGICQWQALHYMGHSTGRGRTGQWILFTTLAWTAGWGVGYLASKLVGWPLANIFAPGLNYPVNIAVGEGVGWFVGWLVVGAITGIAFLRLDWQPQPNPEIVATHTTRDSYALSNFA